MPRTVPADRGGRAGDRPLCVRFPSRRTASGTGRRHVGRRARIVRQAWSSARISTSPAKSPPCSAHPMPTCWCSWRVTTSWSSTPQPTASPSTAAEAARHHAKRRIGGAARCGGQRGPGAARRRAARPHRVSHPGVRRSGRTSAWASLEMAVEYAKVREQFGRTIGTFQAVKHHAANMLVDAEQTTAAVWDAARADDLDSAWFPAAVAASHAVRSQVLNSQYNIQLHGGIGFTWEHDAHLYLRRARTLAALIGDGADPLLDVVEGRAAVRHTAHRSRCPPRPTSTGGRRRRPSSRSGRCPPTSSATSSSTPATWCRTGRSRGAARRMCSSSW